MAKSQQSMRDESGTDWAPEAKDLPAEERPRDDRDRLIDQLIANQQAMMSEIRLLRERQSQPVAEVAVDRIMDPLAYESEAARRRRLMYEATTARLAKLDAEIKAKERELEAGVRRFKVTLSKEPMMTREVGAEDRDHALLKYCRYFGIIGSPGQENVVDISEVAATPTAAA